MAAPQNRVPVRVARGTKGNLDAALALGSLKEGELIYAKDLDQLFIVESGALVSPGVKSDTTQGGLNSIAVANIVSITLANYNALATPNANTIYFVSP